MGLLWSDPVQLGVSDPTCDAWNKQNAHLGMNELRRLRHLEEEYSQLKRVVANISLDKHRLSEALRITVYCPPADEHWRSGFTGHSR